MIQVIRGHETFQTIRIMCVLVTHFAELTVVFSEKRITDGLFVYQIML